MNDESPRLGQRPLPELPDTLVFMMGSPRSGTTWLHAMLSNHPDVCSTGELKVFDHFTGRWEQSWNDLERLVDGDLDQWHGVGSVWSRDQMDEVMRSFATGIFRTVMRERPEASVFLDKTPAYSEHVDHIDRLFPAARFMHVIRDGRDVAVSMIEASKGWGRSWAARSARDAAIRWREYVRAGLSGRRLGERYMELRYEDMLEDCSPVLRRCLAFMHLDVDEEWIEDTIAEHSVDRMRSGDQSCASGRPLPEGFIHKARAGGWREEFTPGEKYEIYRMAGDLLAELGYGEPEWWASGRVERARAKVQALAINPPRFRRKVARLFGFPGQSRG